MNRSLLVFLCALTAPVLADTPVTVEVRNVANAEGSMVLNVYDNSKDWLETGMRRETAPVDGQSTVTFELDLPPGNYAFHAYQDLDDDGEMKSNFIGIPKEPTAVSNDAKGRFGPPKYKDASVAVGTDPVTVPMNLVSID
jgi:uncharacterized protein (DUF2141 family)